MITWTPAILTYAVDSTRRKIADLRELGFADPVKMITARPAILGCAIDNVRGKIADLRELGFADPVKMITSSPAIMGLAIAGMRTKIANLRELGFADPVQMITSSPAILGYAPERLLLCGRILTRLEDGMADDMLARLSKEPRAVIDAVAAAQPRTWSEVRAILAAAKKSRVIKRS
jgi:hypothetical protein